MIIGSGVAGLYTAIRLAEHGRVAVLSKQDLIAGNTWFAQGGIAAAYSAEDSPQIHLEDTWQAGSCFGDRSAISRLVEEAPARIRDLLELGVKFDRRNGSLDLGQEGAHSRHRILHIGGDATGRELVETLLGQARARGIIFLEDAFAERLIVVDGICRGVRYTAGNRSSILQTGVVILAAGGCGQLYKCTSNSPAVTGDGLAMAYWAGAVLQDLEFFQFHPTVFFPSQDSPFLISEAVRGEGAHLVNASGERFMERFHPRGELGPRDIVARAILAEQKQTGKDVCLDLRHLGADYIRARFPTIFARCLEWGLDISCDLIPVSPAAHYMIGGVQVDQDGRTAVENLFAVGEIASTGVHGANRLASNSLLEGLVFGQRVAAAASRIKAANLPGIPATAVNYKKPSRETEQAYSAARSLLQEIMWENVGLIRTAAGLDKARDQFIRWWPLLQDKFSGTALQETQNMLLIGLLMSEAALARRESIGCHYREDYPAADETWGRRHITFRNRGKLPQVDIYDHQEYQ